MVTLPKNCQKKKKKKKSRDFNEKKKYLLRYSFTFQMTPKLIKYVDQEKQDNFSCKHENTLKYMEFSEGDEQLCLLTVHVGKIMV